MGVWVRLHYVYPYPHVDYLVPLMADGLILPYLDIPLQHSVPRILKAMKRPASSENTLARIRQWREICPDITLRSTFIVGFPGETEAEFEQLLDFLQEAQLDRVGCFTYSPVDGAAANALPGAVPEEVKQQRQAQLMELQAEISADKLQKKVGLQLEVLVDEIEDDAILARSYADAPEVDGLVIINQAADLQPGDKVPVRITGSGEHDLYAELLV
jgi:ribosomal protein S12 methylthiotransferase